jgi:hypothetical protein
MNVKILISVVVGGLAMALLTGLVSNTPPMLVGATQYGLPMAWLFRLVIAPEYFPWRVDITRLFVDTAVWAAVVAVVLFIADKVVH